MKDCILLVDDNLAVLKQTSLILGEEYRVVMAKSGEQAVAIGERASPSLILLDVEMPGMDGFATIAALREIPSLAQVPVIFLTGNSDTATQVRALRAGGVDYVKKPFERGVLIHRIRLHIQLSRYQQNLERTVRELEDGIIHSFAEVAESRDLKSSGHLQRTRRYMELFTRILLDEGVYGGELDAGYADTLVRASVLHDIGKIGVDDTILYKPGRLTEAEYGVVKEHSEIGARTLRHINRHTPMSVLLMGAELAEGHHERFDGGGYPRGLVGEGIPLCCRIMSIVNVYDSLRGDTVYRGGMGHGEACGVIGEGAGREFDPVLVGVFMAHADEFRVCSEEMER